VPFENFLAEIEAVAVMLAEDKKSNPGRKPIDVIVMLRVLVLQELYNISDEQIEYQGSDRMSFTRSLRLGIEDRVPDGTTLWLFREALGKAGLIEKLFKRFSRHLAAMGDIERGDQKACGPSQRKKYEVKIRVSPASLCRKCQDRCFPSAVPCLTAICHQLNFV
jgi:hypothetical protein